MAPIRELPGVGGDSPASVTLRADDGAADTAQLDQADRGFAYARLDYLRPALEDLEHYLDERPDAEDATVVESQLHELRQRTLDND